MVAVEGDRDRLGLAVAGVGQVDRGGDAHLAEDLEGVGVGHGDGCVEAAEHHVRAEEGERDRLCGRAVPVDEPDREDGATRGTGRDGDRYGRGGEEDVARRVGAGGDGRRDAHDPGLEIVNGDVHGLCG